MRYEFNLENTIRCDIPVIILQGDITAESDIKIKAAWDEALPHPSPIIAFDFEKTRYINSAGVATLMAIVTRAVGNSRTVLFVNLTPHFRKVVELIGMTDFVQIADTVEEWSSS